MALKVAPDSATTTSPVAVTLRVAFWLVVLIVGTCTAAAELGGVSLTAASLAQDLDAPRPLPGNPFPAYPDRALDISADGDVVFLAIVTAEGRVESVRVREVPAEGVGFEETVRDAVMQWRFEPAVSDGMPRPGVYAGKINFTRQLPYSHSRMYRQSPEVVWREAQEVVAALGRAEEATDSESQILATEWARFDAADFGLPAEESAGSGQAIPQEFQLHVFVSPFVEPARVHVGSISLGPNNVQYNLGVAEEWFFRALEARLEENGQAIPRDPDLHRQAAASLLGTAESCVQSPDDHVSAPSSLTASTPIARQGTNAVVTLEVVISLDGAVTSSRVVEVVGLDPDGMVVAAAAGAMSLWRYRPALSADCPIPFTGTASLILRSSTDPESSPAPAYEGTVYRTEDDGVQPPTLREEVGLRYTGEAARRGIEGDVLLWVVVLPDGSVGDVIVRSSLDPQFGLDDEAVKAVKQWRFQPGTFQGEPVAVLVSIETSFSLENPE